MRIPQILLLTAGVAFTVVGCCPQAGRSDPPPGGAQPDEFDVPPDRVTLVSPGLGTRCELDARQRMQLWEEVGRVRAQAGPGDPREGMTIAPDLEIEASWADGRTERLQLLGRAVLYDVGADLSCQFYMGLLLLEWHAAGAR